MRKVVVLLCNMVVVSSTTICDLCNAGAQGDPHLSLPSGGKADFRGQHKAMFNLLTAKGLSLNVMTELADFELHPADSPRHKVVHGSFLTQAHIVVRTSTGRIARVSYWADKISQEKDVDGFYMNQGWANGTVNSEQAFILTPKREKQVGHRSLLKTTYRLLLLLCLSFPCVRRRRMI